MSRILRVELGLMVRLALSVGLIGGLLYHIGSAEVVRQITAARWQTVVAVVVVLASSNLFVTPRWAAILGALGYRIRMGALIGSVFLGFLFNQLLPTGVGGDVLRAWRAQQLAVPFDVAVHSVLIDRATGVFISLIGAAFLLPFAHPHTGENGLRWVVSAFSAACFAGGFMLWGIGQIPRLQGRFGAGLQRGLVALSNSLWALIVRPAAAIQVFVLACMGQALPVAAIWLLAGELDVPVGPVDIALITFISTLVASIPISLAGWGLREGVLVYLFGLYDINPQTAFAISVLYGASLTISAAPGVLILLRGQSQPPPTRATDRAGDVLAGNRKTK